MNESEIIFWFDSPPKVGKGAFNYVANNWGNSVYYVFNNDFRQERKNNNWDDGDFGKAHIIRLYASENEQKTIIAIFEAHPNAIHIVNGFTSKITKKIKSILLKDKNIRLAILSERPNYLGIGTPEYYFRKLYYKIYYRLIYNKFAPYVKVLLPLGQKGGNAYRKYGWPDHIMFPFMYNPQLKDLSSNSGSGFHTPLRFLYVGRFYCRTKGIDTLIKATHFLQGVWHLDLVGGYGKDAELVHEWIKNDPNISFIGSWDSLQVVNNMQCYDVVIVPSKYDGWNLLVNEAIHAGVGVIVSDEAVSDEVISTSNAGMVVKANNTQQLAQAMQLVINDPELCVKWKQNARNFVANISTETVGCYLISILRYIFYHQGERPRCPWL